MNKFRIVPLSKEYVDKIKITGIDDFGNVVIEEIASGLGPCRYSLKPFRPGLDKRLVISHSPFNLQNAYNQRGPIFISADEVEEYKDVYRFPEEIKKEKDRFKLTLIGYNDIQWMVFAQLVDDNDRIDEMIAEIFNQYHEIEYLHVRSAIASCFICKIVRA
ncbi:MAG: DUF1203 domain-containing protein [Saprospiraceae bacterium]